MEGEPYYPPLLATTTPGLGGLDDGFVWRKYGQKSIAGSTLPRSYYKCARPDCQAKKQVERTDAGEIVFLRYDGKHNHDAGRLPRAAPPARPRAPPPAADHVPVPRRSGGTQRKRPRVTIALSEEEREEAEPTPSSLGGSYWDFSGEPVRKRKPAAKSAALRPMAAPPPRAPEPSPEVDEEEEEEEVGGRWGEAVEEAFQEGAAGDDPQQFGGGRWVGVSGEVAVAVECKDDLLDDGWRWRKYGQKYVRGSRHPRSYYKCTTLNCPMRKHVERSTDQPHLVITTYENCHDHAKPAPPPARSSLAPRPTSEALRKAASALGPRMVYRPAPPPYGERGAAAVAAAQAAAAAAAVAAAARAGKPRPMGQKPKMIRPPPPLTIPPLPGAGAFAGLPSLGPLSAMGRMPLSAVLAGADDDMLCASMTLLGSAKGFGLRPFAGGGASFDAHMLSGGAFGRGSVGEGGPGGWGGGAGAGGRAAGGGPLSAPGTGWTPTEGAAAEAAAAFRFTLDSPLPVLPGTGVA